MFEGRGKDAGRKRQKGDDALQFYLKGVSKMYKKSLLLRTLALEEEGRAGPGRELVLLD